MTEAKPGDRLPLYLTVEVARDPRLKAAAKLIFARLRSLGADYGSAFPAQETLARELGMDVRTVQRSLDKLRACGHLPGTVRRGRRKTNLYLLKGGQTGVSSDPAFCRVEHGKMPSKTRQNAVQREDLEKTEELRDFDYSARSQETRSTRSTPAPRPLMALRQVLRRALAEDPSQRVLEDLMLAAGHGATEAEIVALLESRIGQFPEGDRRRPQTWSWFLSTVQNHYDQQRARALPPGRADCAS